MKYYLSLEIATPNQQVLRNPRLLLEAVETRLSSFKGNFCWADDVQNIEVISVKFQELEINQRQFAFNCA